MDDLLNTAPCGFLCFADDGAISLVNATLAHWLGYEPEELTGRSIDSILSVGGRIFHQTHILPLLIMSGKAEELYFSLKAKNGKSIAMLTNAVRREQEGSGTFANHCVFLPMRQRREYEDELLQARKTAEEASQAKAKFLSTMSHELRTPMNAILGFGQLLQMQELDALQAESVHHILKSGQHLLELINEVLDISLIEAGHLPVLLEAVSAQEIMGEAFDMARPLAAKAGIEIQMPPGSDGEDFVRADWGRLRQILLNLLANGIKYNRAGGRVTIACERATDKTNDEGKVRERLRFSVCDTGMGIAPEQLSKLFVPFERLGAESSEVEGTGLGLALSQRLCEAMGGDIGVQSVPGEGSCFWIGLLLERDIAAGQSTLEAENSPHKPIIPASTLLYIDDSTSNRSLMQRILARRPNVNFLSATNGEFGLELARAQLPDLILLDLQLPDMRGDAVLERLRGDERTRSIPVVMLSADAMPEQVERSLKAGARHYITKPFEISNLLQVVDALLAESNDPKPNHPN